MQTLIELKERLDQVHLVGGGRDILALLEDVERLKRGEPASFGELFGFASWPAVVTFSAAAPDNPVRTLVSLVEQFGEGHLRALIEATCRDPDRASVTLCTAHRAKGLEFDEVRLSADFPAPVDQPTFVQRHGEAALAEAVEIHSPDGPLLILREELQVLYVAATRARYHVTLPPWCYALFADTVGPAPTDVSDEPSASPTPSRPRSATGARTVPPAADVYAIIDFETTGLNPTRGDRVIEIGISRLSGGREVDTFSTFVNPGMPIPPFITDLTGITDAMVRRAPPARKAFERAMAFVGDATLVAHNASFDRKFLLHELRQALGADDERDVLCTLKLSRRIFQSFASHKLGDIAAELGIDTVRSHRALADAQVTAAALAIMLERLSIAHPGAPIDAAFLAAYERRPKAVLPDLTHERQALEAATRERPASPARASRKRTARAANARAHKRSQEDRAARAAAMNKTATEAIDELERLLEGTLSVDDRLDWSALVCADPFRSDLPERSWASYDDDGRPIDIVYATLDEPRPVVPTLLDARPDAEAYAPRLRWWHRAVFSTARRRRDAAEAFQQAIEAWEHDRQAAWARYVEADEAWRKKAKNVDRTNERRYAELVADQQRWEAEKTVHDERIARSRQSVDGLRERYERRSPPAVERYVSEVLSRSVYPEDFPDDTSVRYEPAVKAVEVFIRLLHPDDLPTVQSVTYVKSRDEIKTKSLSASRRNALYADLVRAVCVRTLHELFESDTAEALDHAIVNGYVEGVDPATGQDARLVIASSSVSKAAFSKLRLDRVRASDCFEGLGGRGSARGLAKLTAVTPFEIDGIPSPRVAHSGAVG